MDYLHQLIRSNVCHDLAWGTNPLVQDSKETSMDKPYVCIHPTSNNPLFSWAIDNWVAVVSYLHQQGRSVVITGVGEQDQQIANAISRECPQVKSFVNQLDWRGFVLMIKSADLVISVETVAAHTALNHVKLIALYFGQSQETFWRPYGSNVELLTPINQVSSEMVIQKVMAFMTDNTIKISVAIATYNGALYIEEQVQSMLSQTLMPFEIVISDDGSTDQTFQFLKTCQSSTVPIHIYSNQGKRIHNFMNAMRHCGGDYIALSDQDDVGVVKLAEMAMALSYTHGPINRIGCVYNRCIVNQVWKNTLAGIGIYLIASAYIFGWESACIYVKEKFVMGSYVMFSQAHG